MCKEYEIIPRNKDYSIPAINSNLDAILLSNPNNPTGTHNELSGLIEYTKKNQQLLIVDEAYIELIREKHSIAHLVNDNSYLVVIKTLSKFYGMTKDKIGYIVASREILDQLDTPEPSRNAILLAKTKLNANNKETVRKDIIYRRNILKNIISYCADEIVDSQTNFLMARNSNYPLKELMNHLNVKIVDLDKIKGIEN